MYFTYPKNGICKNINRGNGYLRLRKFVKWLKINVKDILRTHRFNLKHIYLSNRNAIGLNNTHEIACL